MKRLLLIPFLFVSVLTWAQLPVILHSHNDYNRTAPFWEAYSQHCASIEADVFLSDGKLLVGHDEEDLTPERNLDAMYIQPIVQTFRSNGGRMWKDSPDRLILMIELKSPAEDELPEVVKALEKYPDVFSSENGVRIAITGNVPPKEDFLKYPSWIGYDGDIRDDYSPMQLERVVLVSNSFRMFSRKWNGKGRMIDPELAAVKAAIEKVHSWGKPIRFWDAPEGTTAYFTFWKLGVDIIGTDKPAVASQFFSDWGNKNFIIGRHNVQSGVTGTKHPHLQEGRL